MNFTLNELSEQEINLILTGLGELPYRVSVNIIAKINQRCQDQLKELKEVKDKEIKPFKKKD